MTAPATEADRIAQYRENEQNGERCAICCEPVSVTSGADAEMYDPEWADQEACFMVHGECGAGQRWAVG